MVIFSALFYIAAKISPSILYAQKNNVIIAHVYISVPIITSSLSKSYLPQDINMFSFTVRCEFLPQFPPNSK